MGFLSLIKLENYNSLTFWFLRKSLDGNGGK